MRAHVITDGVITNTILVATLDILPGLIDAALGGKIGDTWDGEHFSTPIEVVGPVALQKSIVDAVQARLDNWALTYGYGDEKTAPIVSMCTYATSSIPKFAIEGQLAVDLRSETWAACFTFMAEVQGGVRPIPSGYADIEPFLPLLPEQSA